MKNYRLLSVILILTLLLSVGVKPVEATTIHNGSCRTFQKTDMVSALSAEAAATHTGSCRLFQKADTTTDLSVNHDELTTEDDFLPVKSDELTSGDTSLHLAGTTADPLGDSQWLNAPRKDLDLFIDTPVAFSETDYCVGNYHLLCFNVKIPETGMLTINLKEGVYSTVVFNHCLFDFRDRENPNQSVLAWEDITNHLNDAKDAYYGSASGRIPKGDYCMIVALDQWYFQRSDGCSFNIFLHYEPEMTPPQNLRIKSAAKSITVNWEWPWLRGAYDLQYSTSKDFSEDKTKTVAIKKPNIKHYKIKKLKKHTTYYIRMRACFTILFTGIGDQRTYVSEWSNRKKTKTK